jgi:hypothetical protein
MADQPSPDDVTAAELLGAATVRVLALRPDDVLVLLYPERLSQAAVDRIRGVIRGKLGLEHQRVLVLDSGADPMVIRPEDLAQAGT